MKFNPLDLFKKQNKGYIGLLLRESDGVIMYLETVQGGDKNNPSGLEVIDKEDFNLSHHWDHLVDDIDDALYKLEVRTKKTFDDVIFFVYSHLIDDTTHEIKRQHLAKIKNLVKSMELKPLGFIETHEAFQGYLQKKEGKSFTGVIVEPDESVVSVLVFYDGKMSAQVSAHRRRALTSDLEELFTGLKETIVLPARILCLPPKNSEDGAELVEHTWEESLFEKTPEVQLIQESELTDSLVQTFASQIFSVSPVVVKESVEVEPETVNNKTAPLHPDDEVDLDEDLALSGSDEEVRQPATEERMGFVIGGSSFNDSPEEETRSLIKPAFTDGLSKVVETAKNFAFTLVKKLQTIPFFQKRSSAVTALICFGALLILGAWLLIEYSFHKATVSLLLPSQSITLQKTFTDEQLDVKVGSDTAKFDAQTPATGVREVGESAKGTVTIYNSNRNESKTLAKGTTLTGPSNLRFTLDTEVKLASASGDAIDIVSSTAKAAVTAAAIGPESNLAGNTKFSVEGEDTSSVVAQSDGAFSGGTRREIQVVSNADLANARKAISTKASDYVKNNLRDKLGKDAVLLTQLTSTEISSEDASAAVGTEATLLKLDADVSVQYAYISDKQLKESLIETLQPKASAGLTVSEKTTNYTIRNVTSRNGNTNISVQAKANAVMPIEEKKVLSTIKGKGVGSLEKVAKETYQATGVEYEVEHPIGFLKGFLPIFSKNIKVNLLYP